MGGGGGGAAGRARGDRLARRAGPGGRAPAARTRRRPGGRARRGGRRADASSGRGPAPAPERPVASSPMAGDEELEHEDEEELPAWSLTSERARPLTLPGGWPDRVDREWAWGGSTGRGVRVCILDSGVEDGHPLVGHVESSVAVSVDGDDISVTEDREGDLCG